MKLGDRLNAVLTGLLMLPEGRAVDPTMNGYGTSISTGKGGHGTHKARGSAPSGSFVPLEDRPAVVQWAERFERMIQVAERELEAARRGEPARAAANDTRSKRRRDETQAILEDYVGVHPVDVAFLLRRDSSEAIARLRARHGRDPLTGEHVRRDVLTAHPRHYAPPLPESTTPNPQEDG